MPDESMLGWYMRLDVGNGHYCHVLTSDYDITRDLIDDDDQCEISLDKRSIVGMAGRTYNFEVKYVTATEPSYAVIKAAAETGATLEGVTYTDQNGNGEQFDCVLSNFKRTSGGNSQPVRASFTLTVQGTPTLL